MNLTPTEEQTAIRDLARGIFEGLVTPERLREVEAGPDRFDRALWQELARAGLLGAGVAEADGGIGGGMLELCVFLEEAGRSAAPIPAWAAATAALAMADLGGDASLLRAMLRGESLVVAALLEPGSDDPAQPATVALPDGEAWKLDGAKTSVPYAALASHLVVTALTADGPALFVLETAGAEIAPQRATSGEPQGLVTLTRAPARLLTAEPDAAAWLHDRALTAMCAVAAGLADRALHLTAEYVTTRYQFERPLGTFQAVQQRLADAYIDVEAMRWTMWQAAWRLDEGLPAREEVAVAKYWASDGGHRVFTAAQHLHGGIGVDVDYPLHRYTRAAKQIEMSLGGAARQLARLGDMISTGGRA
jgi:alkylation response protein AidB-like acyl-CoA dehydrogenase